MQLIQAYKMGPLLQVGFNRVLNGKQVHSEMHQKIIREAFRKKTIESVSMLIPPSDPPPPPYCERLRLFFFLNVFWIIGVVWYAVKQIL